MKLRWKIILGIIALLLIGGGVMGWRIAHQAPVYKTYTVVPRSVVQEVAFTGKLQSVNVAQLAFDSTGTITSLPVALGDRVEAGQVLARIDSRGQTLDVAQAAANRAAGVDVASQAASDAAVAAQKTQQTQAATIVARQQAVRDAKKEMDHRQDIWQQVVREAGDQSSTSQSSYALFLSAQTAYRAAQEALTGAQASAGQANQAAQAAAQEAQAKYVSTLQAARGASGLSSLGAAEAMANLRLSKTAATAPFAGVISAKGFSVGELAPAGTPVVTVETTDHLQIVAQVPESDITKLALGMQATFTLDAFTDNKTWQANIVSIAPAAKVIEGVPTYEVKLELAQSNQLLKPGMTANVIVQPSHREQVLAVPRRSIVRTNGIETVNVLKSDGVVEEVPVKLGILDSDGYVEIIQGLSAGAQVVLPSSS